jgi:hypothetical protein
MNTDSDQAKTQLGNLIGNLLNTLESGDTARIRESQQALSSTIITFWSAVEENASGIEPGNKAISRLVAGWAAHELPWQVHDPANYAEIKRQLKILQRSLILFS